jgi:hypothetical protein
MFGPMMGAGTQKIEMGRTGDTDYISKKNAALAQAQQNAFMFGVQNAGSAVEATRDPLYGSVNLETNALVQGQDSAFAQSPGQNAGNMGLENPPAQTGYLAGGVSSTVLPQVEPQFMGDEAQQRVMRMASGQQAGLGLNDRARILGQF